MSDLVTEVKIVSSNGTLHTFAKDRDPEAFSAAVLNLGLLGIIYSYTIQVNPMFKLYVTESYPLAREYLVDPKSGGPKLRDLVLNNFMTNIEYCLFSGDNFDPAMDRLWLKEWRQTDNNLAALPAPNGFHSVLQYIQAVVGYTLGQIMVAIPFVTPLILHHVYGLLGNQASRVEYVPYSIHAIGGGDIFRHMNMGFAFKADSNFENVVKATRYVIDLMYGYAHHGWFPLNIALGLRFIKSSRLVLSHVYDEDPDAIYCMIEVQSFKDTPGFDDFSKSIAQYWMDNFQARPQWATLWEDIPGIIPYLKQNMDTRFDKFDAVRRIYDPNGMFLTGIFEVIFETEHLVVPIPFHH
ncbi:hypothetical protein BGZ73_001568 [Actinomortierella ambigua]|nr:hypothetical protein BGZ73_001568 [Actinomortierella ambigua]